MSASNSLETAILALIFNNTDFEGVGDAGGLLGAETAGDFYVSLHTADPGEGGDQESSESAYTNYERIAVERSPAGWTVTGNAVANTEAVAFPVPGASGLVAITHFGIGTEATGPGILLFKGVLSGGAFTPTEGGTPPNFAAGALSVTAD